MGINMTDVSNIILYSKWNKLYQLVGTLPKRAALCLNGFIASNE